MPARNRNPIQMSKVSLACLALLVAVCGGYFALVPFLRAIEPSPQFGQPAAISSTSSSVDLVLQTQTQTARDTHRLVSNPLRTKKPKHKTHKPSRPVTVPTRPVFVNHP